MNRPHRLLAVILPILAGMSSAAAATPGEAPPSWEQLTPAQREQLIAPIRERWNAQPEYRTRMLAHAERWQRLTPEQRRHARRGMAHWEHMTPDERKKAHALFSRMRSLPEAQGAGCVTRWQSMSPGQKRDAVQQALR